MMARGRQTGADELVSEEPSLGHSYPADADRGVSSLPWLDDLALTADREDTPLLASLLDLCTPSVRLTRMLEHTSLGAIAADVYVARRDEIEVWMLGQPNCGRRSVAELRDLIHLLGPVGTVQTAREDVATLKPVELKPGETLLAEFSALALPIGDQLLVELVVPETVGPRLAKIISDGRLGAKTLSNYLLERLELETWMMGQPNCGRRTVRELRQVIANRICLELSSVGGATDSWTRQIASAVDVASPQAPAQEGPPEDGSIRDIISWHLASLPARTAEILTLRFGLDCEPRTLAEIGELHSVTRERIRQIEAKALRRLRAISQRRSYDAQLENARTELVAQAFGSALHISDARLERVIKALDGYVAMTLDMVGLDPKRWFAQTAARLGTGWLRPGLDAQAVEAIATRLKIWAANRPFPRPVAELVEGRVGDYFLAAAELVLGWHVRDAYIFDRRPRARLLRTVVVHAVLARRNEPTELSELLNMYRAAAPADPCSDRDLLIVMEAAPHLFIETYEGCWASIGLAGDLPDRAEETPAHIESNAREIDDATIAFSLEQELRKTGPLRVSQLINRAIDIIPCGRSANSVGPTLLLHPSRFIRILPGVYALPDQVPDDNSLGQAKKLDYLLNPQQARLLALARWAEEPWGTYPLWTIRAEMRICRWARAGRHENLLRSLLSVASIEKWPTDDADRQIWSELRDRQARFELEFPPRPRSVDVPLDRVLAAMLHLRTRSSIGWMTGNRILGYGPDSSAVAPLLAGMVRSDILSSPADNSWQRRHDAGPRLDEWIARLARELHETGELEWDGEAGRALSQTFGSHSDCEAPDEQTIHEEFDEFEAMMAEHRRSVQLRRHEARLEMAEENDSAV